MNKKALIIVASDPSLFAKVQPTTPKNHPLLGLHTVFFRCCHVSNSPSYCYRLMCKSLVLRNTAFKCRCGDCKYNLSFQFLSVFFVFFCVFFLWPPLHHPCPCFRLVPLNTIKNTDKSNICSFMITTAAMQPKLHRGFKATQKQTKKLPGRKGKNTCQQQQQQLFKFNSSSSTPLQDTIMISSSHTPTRCKTPNYYCVAGPLVTSFDPHTQHHVDSSPLPQDRNLSQEWARKVRAKSEVNIIISFANFHINIPSPQNISPTRRR
jgi:hypothetical protein